MEKEIRHFVKDKEKLSQPDRVCVVLSTSYPLCDQVLTNAELEEDVNEIVHLRDSGGVGQLIDEKENVVTDNLRASLALQSVRNLADQGVNVVVIDGGSSDIFKQELKGVAGITFREQKIAGYSESRREGMKEATEILKMNGQGDKGVIMQMEPEKIGLTSSEMMRKMVEPVLEGQCLVTVLNRGITIKDLSDDTKSWNNVDEGDNYAGYPPYQARSEMWLNNKFADTIRKVSGDEGVGNLDLLNGTRVFANKPEVLSLFFNRLTMDQSNGVSKPEVYFNAVYLPILEMAAGGMVGLIRSVDYVGDKQFYPRLQQLLESSSPLFNVKRDKQRQILSQELDNWFVHYLERRKGKTGKIIERENLNVEESLAEYFDRKINSVLNKGVLKGVSQEQIIDGKPRRVIYKRSHEGVHPFLSAFDSSGVDRVCLGWFSVPKKTEKIFAFPKRDQEGKGMRISLSSDVTDEEAAFVFGFIGEYLDTHMGRQVLVQLDKSKEFSLSPENNKFVGKLIAKGVLKIERVDKPLGLDLEWDTRL